MLTATGCRDDEIVGGEEAGAGFALFLPDGISASISSDLVTTLHPWSCIIISILVFCLSSILVKVEKGLEAMDDLIQIGALVEEWDDRVRILEDGQ